MASSPANRFLALAERSLRFEWQCGASSALVATHTTGWRRWPATIVTHVEGRILLELDGRRPITVRDGAFRLRAGVHHRSSAIGAGWCRWIHAMWTLFGAVDALTHLELPPVLPAPAAAAVARLNERLAVEMNRP